MRYIKLFFVSFLLLGVQSLAFSQQDSIPITTLVERNKKLVTDIPVEKVYLHFDKPYYAIGDTIWFKTYLTSIQNIPSPLSKIVYVDILTNKDSIVNTLKIPVTNSVAQGSIILSPFAYKQGNYHIRAYTKWMLNFNSAYYFTKNLPVGNAINKELNTHIAFSNAATEKSVKVNAKVLFKNEDNRPYANRRVSWEVIVDYDRISRGRGTTDANGYLNIEFSSSRNVALNSGQLYTTIEIANNKTLKTSFPLKSAVSENDIQFFPEGGELVNGLPSQVAFKAIQSNGLGADVKSGQIVDSEGKVLANISSQHLGMGKFSFTPEDNKVYFANVNFSDGSKGTYSLPKAQSEGIILSVNNNDTENLRFAITANQAYLQKNVNKGFYIIGRSGGVIYYAAKSIWRNQAHSTSILKKNFPSGVVQLSILAPSGKILSERLVFIDQPDSLTMKLSADLPKYKQRQKVKMKLNATMQGKPVLGSFSVAVIDESKVPVNQDKETTIFSSLQLSSEIEGYIENPSYYFYNKNNKKQEDLDLLMLTQGYRKYLYKDIIANKPNKIAFLPEQSLSVSGMIRRNNGMPLTNGRLLLQIPERSFYKDGVTDAKGRFNFTNLVFQDSVEVIVNARNNLNSDKLMITIDGDPYPAIAKNVNLPDEVLNLDSVLSTYLHNSKLQNSSGFLLKEVKIEVNAKKPSHADHAALTGLNSEPTFLIQGDKFAGCNNVLNCLSSSPGLIYIDEVLYLSKAYNAGSKIPVEIYLNGMPVDLLYLQNMQPIGIESVEVFENDGLSEINQRSNTKGVVVINMKEVKKTKLSAQEIKDLFPPTNIMKFMPKGYSVERRFYVPKYTGPRTTLQTADNRTTVYWNPYLLTDTSGNVDFEYFNADGKGTYRVVIEGFDINGYIGRKVYRYVVQ